MSDNYQQQENKPANSAINRYPQQLTSIEHITLRQLKLRNRQTENAIHAVEARINFMKTKEEKTVKKVLNVKRKLTSLDRVKIRAKQQKQISQEQKRKMEDSQAKKAEFNKLIKDHLKYNKKIVMTLMSHKVGEESRAFKQKLEQLSMLSQIQRESLKQQNAEKANRIRLEQVDAHQKRKIYFLDKLQQFKQFKQQRLKEELKQRQRQQMMISELEQRQRTLLQRLSVSQKFRLKCQQQYQDAKKKYHSFYEASKGINLGNSRGYSAGIQQEERKADIFIS